MNYLCALLLFMASYMERGFAQTTNSYAPFASQQAKELYIRTHDGLPLENYNVGYFTTNGGASLTPAYVDLASMTAYSWTGVVLQPDQIPLYYTHFPNGGSFLIAPVDPAKSNLQFKQIDPPTYYKLLPDGKYAAGYYDHGNGIYYRWGDLEFDKSQLPSDAASKHRVLPLGRSKDPVIPPPLKSGGKPTGTRKRGHSSLFVPKNPQCGDVGEAGFARRLGGRRGAEEEIQL
ncbi:MAG TPA: hypothetical protein VIM62_01700 [Acidobacteriaceae bacterium]